MYCPLAHTEQAGHRLSNSGSHPPTVYDPLPQTVLALHTVSALALQAVFWYCAHEHWLQAVQIAFLVPAHVMLLNHPSLHVVHVWHAQTSGTRYCPVGHNRLHTRHTVSLDVVHARAWYVPEPHTLQLRHTVLFVLPHADTVYVPLPHTVHELHGVYNPEVHCAD